MSARRFWRPQDVDRSREQQERNERVAARQAALEHDAGLWRVLMDPRRHAPTVPEALRGTARGAVEDWLEQRDP